MRFICFTECSEPEQLNISEIFYEIKEYRLIEISLDNWYAIRQWKDVPIKYTNPDSWETFDMDYWKIYCLNWNRIESVREWRWEKELMEFIETCENYI